MKKPQVILSQYSPLMLVDIPVIDSTGARLDTPRVYSLCRCGASANKPFCDGTHSRINFVGSRNGGVKAPQEAYVGRDITILYDRHLCMGAGYCGELEAVFGTHDAPKYEPDAAPAEAIIATINKCPSGALSYRQGGHAQPPLYGEAKVVVERDGPLHCHGPIELIDDQDSDQLLPAGDHFTLCRCGQSKKRPFCDGSHATVGFKG